MELQLVRVPVVWKAKVPEKKLFPVTRKVPEQRAIERRARAAAQMFMAQLMAGVPDMFIPDMFKDKSKDCSNKIMIFRRYRPLPPWEDE